MSSIPFISHRMFVAAVNPATPPRSHPKEAQSPARNHGKRRTPASKNNSGFSAQNAGPLELEILAANGG